MSGDSNYDSQDEFLEGRGVISMSGATRERYEDENDKEEQVFGVNDESSDSDTDEQRLAQFKRFNRFKDIDQSQSEGEEEEEEGVEGWGRKRNEYYASDDYSDDEEAKEEEKEALMMQKSRLSTLKDQDFLDDDFETLTKGDAPNATEILFDDLEEDDAEQIKTDVTKLSVKERAKLLQSTMPDVVEVLKEYAALQKNITESSADVDSNIMMLKHLYATNLTFYLALATSEEAGSRLNHPVAKQLENLRILLHTAANLSFIGIQSDDGEEERAESVFEGEENDIEEESEVEQITSEVEEEEEERYDEYVPIVEKKKKRRDDKFGESGINSVDLEDKIRNKRSIQFHVSQVDQSRSNMSKPSIQGDSDLPYKTKKSSEPKRDALEGSDINDIYGEISDHSDEAEEEEEVEEEEVEDDDQNDYYASLKQQKRKRRDEKESLNLELNKPVITGDLYAEADLDATDKRKATYKILANKGLTPRRKKENRNPRVKKRLKYEAAVKKLSSTRRVAVDKSKINKYQGEMTGIKKNLSRSTKF